MEEVSLYQDVDWRRGLEPRNGRSSPRLVWAFELLITDPSKLSHHSIYVNLHYGLWGIPP